MDVGLSFETQQPMQTHHVECWVSKLNPTYIRDQGMWIGGIKLLSKNTSITGSGTAARGAGLQE